MTNEERDECERMSRVYRSFDICFFFESGYYNASVYMYVSEGDIIIYDEAYARIRSRVVRFKYRD